MAFNLDDLLSNPAAIYLMKQPTASGVISSTMFDSARELGQKKALIFHNHRKNSCALTLGALKLVYPYTPTHPLLTEFVIEHTSILDVLLEDSRGHHLYRAEWGPTYRTFVQPSKGCQSSPELKKRFERTLTTLTERGHHWRQLGEQYMFLPPLPVRY